MNKTLLPHEIKNELQWIIENYAEAKDWMTCYIVEETMQRIDTKKRTLDKWVAYLEELAEEVSAESSEHSAEAVGNLIESLKEQI